jgi:hypothetical protein
MPNVVPRRRRHEFLLRTASAARFEAQPDRILRRTDLPTFPLVMVGPEQSRSVFQSGLACVGKPCGVTEDLFSLVPLTFASWNRISHWLTRIEAIRQAA